MSKSVVRSVKNVTKGYSSVQVKVRNATSNDAWGPSGTDMSEIAQLTYNNTSDFYEIMDMLDKRLNDKGKNWRHVLKSLKVLDYCLHEGSELVVTWARKNMYIIKTLREFQYIDEEGRDVGLNVRHSAKELTSLILDEERLRAERHDRKLWKSRVTGLDESGGLSGYGNGMANGSPKNNRRRPQREDEDDLEYRLAIEASKNQEEEDRKRRNTDAGDMDDEDLAKAIKLSKEEEELRRRELENKNAASLFDDTPAQPQPTGYNQGYQQQAAVDWFGNPMEQQQQQQQQMPQTTGFLNNTYAQQQMPQQTGFQTGYGYNPYQQQQQPQQTGFNQYQQQQYMQPQQTAFNMGNPYATNGGYPQQQQQQQQQQPMQQQDTAMQSGSKNPWASNGDSSDPWDNLKPQQTGSNNPFASGFARPQSQPKPKQPTLNTLQEERVQTQYSQPQQATMAFQAQPTAQQAKPMDPRHAQLNALLASGEGQDTFGNTGNMRIPAQHTAPGTFVNSAGSGLNRLQVNQTGSNPFFTSQYTGMPQQSMAPAQTGPVGFGGSFGASNPYSPQQQRQGGQQGGSLIDL